MTPRGRPNLTFKGRPWEVDSGRPQDVLTTSSRGNSSLKLGCPKIYQNFFFRTYSIDQIYLKAFQHSRCIENPVRLLRWCIFCEDGAFFVKLVHNFLAVNCFHERTSWQNLDWVFNTPLILPSNGIWQTYRPIAETNTFRFGVSLTCLLCVKGKRIGKKIYYRKIEYITSDSKNFQAYVQETITCMVIQHKSTLNLRLLFMNT